MKILFLNHNVARKGGTFFRAFHAARHLVRLGHEVTLMTISTSERWRFHCEHSDGVEIVHTPDLLTGLGRTGWDPWDAFRRIVALHNRTWDIVHAWDCRPVVILPALWARHQSQPRGKLIIDWCDWWGRGGIQSERPGSLIKTLYSPVETYFEEAFRKYADGTTVASAELSARAVQAGAKDSPMLWLPGGSDAEAIRPMDKASARRQLGWDEQAWIVGYLGSLPLRESELVYDVVERVRIGRPNTQWAAIGVNVVGSTLSLKKVLGSRWRPWIIDTGRIPLNEVGLYLSACDVLILPMRDTTSNRARWPSKINDYLAAGRPIVATGVGEVAQILQRFQAGLIADNTPESFAECLHKLFSNTTLSAELGRNGRLLAEGDLNWETISAQLGRFYLEVMRGQQEPALTHPKILE